jgi:four helix bundle protein
VKRNHKDLIAWQKARVLAVTVYQLTACFPETERYGMTSQMRRAAVSVLSNISEGAARSSGRDLLRFLRMARGSLAELEAQILIANELRFFANSQLIEQRVSEVGRLINGLISSTRRRRYEATSGLTLNP